MANFPYKLSLAGAFLCVFMLTAPAGARKKPVDAFPNFPLLFHVAETKGKPVRTKASLRAQVSRANAIFKPTKVRFVAKASSMRIPDSLSEIRSRRDRHLLAQHLKPKVINCFMVEALHNVDEPGVIRGVHWRSTRGEGDSKNKVHYVIVSKIAAVSVLAHELGHYFGNKHSPTPGNIMSYTKGEGLPFFDVTQIRRVRRFAKRFRSNHEIK